MDGTSQNESNVVNEDTHCQNVNVSFRNSHPHFGLCMVCVVGRNYFSHGGFRCVYLKLDVKKKLQLCSVMGCAVNALPVPVLWTPWYTIKVAASRGAGQEPGQPVEELLFQSTLLIPAHPTLEHGGCWARGATAHLGCRAASQESPASGTALCITIFSN